MGGQIPGCYLGSIGRDCIPRGRLAAAHASFPPSGACISFSLLGIHLDSVSYTHCLMLLEKKTREARHLILRDQKSVSGQNAGKLSTFSKRLQIFHVRFHHKVSKMVQYCIQENLNPNSIQETLHTSKLPTFSLETPPEMWWVTW